MRVAELSERTGVSVATIKYYLRVGLLHRGERTGPNQARYDEGHERRLRLVRALVEVGGLSIAATRDVLAFLDDSAATVPQRLGRAMFSVTQVRRSTDTEGLAAARRIVSDLIERRGWRIEAGDPACENLVEVIAAIGAMRGPGRDALLTEIDRFAELAEIAARGDLDTVLRLSEPDDAVEAAVVGTLVGDTLIAGLRRVAQVNESLERFGAG